ncbi:MAG TPA: endolytic transglycosylase MltG [Candidatus Limnocylindria bacterium]|nr:endolytic transglycosylase MltG [Candidatus Limnocylindria bacterium]
MTRRPVMSDYDERRNRRIRELREQREAPVRRRRRVQPLLLLAWIAGSIALLGILIVFGFNVFFAPRVMAWVEQNPGAISNGIVEDFVRWYRPEELADEPASSEIERVTVDVPQGASDAQISKLLYDAGLIKSQIAFHYQVIQAGREGTLNFGTYDLSPTLTPSQIIAAMKGEAVETTTVTIREGLRLEEVVAAVGATDPPMTVNLEELAALLEAPPADLLNQYDFLADLPAGRSLEGYLSPDTYNMDITWSETKIAQTLLDHFGEQLTQEIRDGIAAKGLTIDEAVIIASIVEREAVIDDERPLIAAVYINRYLNPDNPQTVGLLNADPTLQYGLTTSELRPEGHPLLQGTEGSSLPVDSWGSADWWPMLQTTGGDVALPDSLAGFQTYLNPGIPPMPIANPRPGSIAAVANAPLDQGYLFFVAGCPGGTRDGSHYFAATLDEHNANIARANEECAGQ